MDAVAGFGGVFLASAVGVFALGVSQPPSPSPLPGSALPVTLVGVATDPAAGAKSACLVRCTDPEEKPIHRLLAIGQRACDVAEIIDILPETVVIRNLLTNRLELLTFPTAGQAGLKACATGEGIGSAALEGCPAATELPAAPRVLVKSPNLVTIDVPRESVEHYLANLPELLSSALATPRYRPENGQLLIEGFKIERIKEASVIEQLGLQNGDAVLEVNGEKLDGMGAVVRLLGQAPVMAQAVLIVLRNGQRMTFLVNMK
jgi:membrane-associated protease RseP (regulator of RpoE activity)